MWLTDIIYQRSYIRLTLSEFNNWLEEGNRTIDTIIAVNIVRYNYAIERNNYTVYSRQSRTEIILVWWHIQYCGRYKRCSETKDCWLETYKGVFHCKKSKYRSVKVIAYLEWYWTNTVCDIINYIYFFFIYNLVLENMIL